MLDELTRANSIITEFLNLAKNKVSDKQMQNINTIIKALFPLIQAEALRASKHVILDLSKCPDISIDEKEIRQFILNMALNGLDAMSSGGKLTIKTIQKEQAVILANKRSRRGHEPRGIKKNRNTFLYNEGEGNRIRFSDLL